MLETPKGLFTRSELEWGGAGVGLAHADLSVLTANPAVSLFNNATDGTSLRVCYLNGIFSQATGSIFCRFVFGSYGAFEDNARAIRLGDPQPWGQSFTKSDPNAAPTYTSNFLRIFQNTKGGVYGSEYPIAILPPGWSMVCQYSANETPCIQFWYTLD